MRKIIGSIDLGSDTIKLIIGENFDNKINILLAVETKTRGYKNGEIINEDEFINCLKKLLNDASDKLGFRLRKLIANLPSSENNFVISEVTNTVTNEDKIISGDDILRVLQSAAYNKVSESEELVSVMPVIFRVDDEETTEPFGKNGKKLTLKAILVTAPKYEMYEYISVLEKCGIEVVDITTTGLVDYYNFKNELYDEKTGIVVNLGEYTANLSVFNKGKYINNEVIETGGIYIDQEIAAAYNLNLNEAKKLKEKLALASNRRANPKEITKIVNEAREELTINQYELTEIVANRVEETLKLTKKSINLLTKKEISYIIITGGLTELKDFPLALASVFGNSAKVGTINTIGVRSNKYSTALGMIKYFNDKLSLRQREYSTISETDAEMMCNENSKSSSDSIIGKVFGYFFDS